MKTEYARDNTSSSIIVVLSLAIAVALIAALIGLADKPDVPTIGIAVGADSAAADSTNATAPTLSFDDTADVQANLDTEVGNDGPATEAAPEPTQQVIAIPTTAPTPTPQIVAAVEPETASEAVDEAQEVATLAAPSLPTSSGTVQGEFFTAGDENEGATVAQNLITISFAEDGSGEFQGVLDITYADSSRILLNMSGPLNWVPTNPQVETVLAGAYTLDSPIDADDITTNDAELTITSLQAGSGSLCTTKCFGFTFPPQ